MLATLKTLFEVMDSFCPHNLLLLPYVQLVAGWLAKALGFNPLCLFLKFPAVYFNGLLKANAD